MVEPKWKLGEDMHPNDAIFDQIVFQDLILAVHCNCPVVNPAAVKATAREILDGRLTDFWYLIDNNMDEIIDHALKGRGGYEEDN